MTFTVSPGVVTREIELTAVVPEAGTTSGGFAGVFGWGPIEEVTNVSSEENLKTLFAKPDSLTYNSFFTAANFLAYGNTLRLVRVANTSALNASTSGSGVLVKNNDAYDATYDPDFGGTPVTSYGNWIARHAGTLGNSLKISMCGADKPSADLSGTVSGNSTVLTGTSTDFTGEVAVGDVLSIGDDTFIAVTVTNTTSLSVATTNASASPSGASATRLIRSGYEEGVDNMIGTVNVAANGIVVTGNDTRFDLQITAGDILTIGGQEVTVNAVTNAVHLTLRNALSNSASQNTFTRKWEYNAAFDYAPGTSAYASRKGSNWDEVHLIVVDEDGDWTSVKNQVLETYPALSVAPDARAEDGTAIFYKRYVNRVSNYVRWMDHDGSGDANADLGTIAWGADPVNGSNYTAGGIVVTESFANGADGSTVTNGETITGFDKFKSNEVDVALIPTGNASAIVCSYVINNIAEVRKDCMVLCSPPQTAVVNNSGSEASEILAFRNSLPSSSYGVVDTGYKYQYDRYNDLYRYVPTNGDVAGLMVRTALERDFFYSPAGFTRGQIKNTIKLAYNPQKPDRDTLYKAGVNSVVSFPGQGTILFGDKTLLGKANAFDRINIRRLFITLEKSISRFAEASMFEFNDEFTRSRFVSSVEPYLRDIQGRGGITDFAVICDDTNNTTEVIERNEFVGSIFVKPQRSINFILLNFVAVRSGVEFSEVVNVV